MITAVYSVQINSNDRNNHLTLDAIKIHKISLQSSTPERTTTRVTCSRSLKMAPRVSFASWERFNLLLYYIGTYDIQTHKTPACLFNTNNNMKTRVLYHVSLEKHGNSHHFR